MFSLRKWISAVLASAMLFSSLAGFVSAAEPPGSPAGATYFQGRDNLNNAGEPESDGDLDTYIYHNLNGTNGSDNHPIEFTINVEDASNIQSAALLIRAKDVDEEQGEWDRVFFGPLDSGKEVGKLTGNNEIWNTTAIYLDPALLKEGDNYIEIIVDDDDGDKDYNWRVEVDWGQLVINGGPKGEVQIGPDVSVTNIPSGAVADKGRRVVFDVNSTGDQTENTYVAEINLIDPNGNNIGTIQKEFTFETSDEDQQITVDFDDTADGGVPNFGYKPNSTTEPEPNPINPDWEYTANIIIYEKNTDGSDTNDTAALGRALDIWASNKPPVVYDIDLGKISKNTEFTFTRAMFEAGFKDLDDTPDPIQEVKIESLPSSSQGTLYYDGSAVTAGLEIDIDDIEGLTFVPSGSWDGNEVSFQWNGYDGTIYALSPALVEFAANEPPSMKLLERAANQGEAIAFDDVDFTVAGAVYEDADNDPLKKIKIETVPTHGTLYNGAEPVGAGSEFSPEQFKTLQYRAANDEWSGADSFQWSGSDGMDYSSPARVDLEIFDVVVPSITGAAIEDEAPDQVRIFFDEPIVLTSGTDGFTVTVDGAAVDTVDAEVSGDRSVILTLQEPLIYGQDVKLTYTGGSENVLDKGYPVPNPANPAGNLDVANNVKDREDPYIRSARIEDGANNRIQLQFNEPIGFETGTNGFSATVNGRPVTVTEATYADGDQFELILEEPVRPGDVVWIHYDEDEGTVADDSDNPLRSIRDYPVANGVRDHEPPKLIEAVIEDEEPNKVKLTYHEPIQATDADGILVTVNGAPATVTGVTYDDNGLTLTLKEPVEAGDAVKYTYQPSDGSVTDLANNNAEQVIDFTVKNLVRKPLDGWVGSRPVTDTNDIFAAPGDPLKLSAVSSVLADRVVAILFGGQSGLERQVELTLVDEKPGYKTWEYVLYRLPDKAGAGTYQAEFASYAEGELLPAETSDRMGNNAFHVVTEMNVRGKVTDSVTGQPIAGAKVALYEANGASAIKPFATVTDAQGNYAFTGVPSRNVQIVVEKEQYGTKKRVIRALPVQAGQSEIVENVELSPFTIAMTANPSSIVGDGVSSTLLTAEITDREGRPVPNTEIVFTAPAGSFEGGYEEDGLSKIAVTTNADGKATVKYISEAIEGIVSRDIPVTASVNDVSLGLKGEEQIIVAFHPARIHGVVTSTAGGTTVPAPGAIVRISKDFDGDGIIDFAAEAVTDKDGKYSIAVPRGGAGIVYDVEISKPVQTADGEVFVTYKQKAPVLQEVVGVGQEFDSEKTITGLVGLQSPDNGQLKLIGGSAMADKLLVYLKEVGGGYVLGEDGKPRAFPLEGAGVFTADGVEAGKQYEIELKYVMSEAGKPDKEILLNRNDDGSLPIATISEDGQLNIAELLVDPYGTVTDGRTGEVIEGAKVMLYYADTQRNEENGRTANTGVELPELVGFEPNDNASPEQLTDANGFYAYMVFPEADYYITVEKSGYRTYTSDVISVEWDIVKHDVELFKRSSGGGSSRNTEKQVALNLAIDGNRVKEGSRSTVTVEYKNESSAGLVSGEIIVRLPEGAAVIDADGGTIEDNAIVWSVDNLPAGQSGAFEIVLEWPMLESGEAEYEIAGTFAIDGSGETADAASSLKLQVFSDRFGSLRHQRYILGFPDGNFKPERSLTRAELAAIVARLTETVTVSEPLKYSDVGSGHWAENYIKIATKNGYFSGFEDGTFRPEAMVTRGELASVMARYLKLEVGTTAEPRFGDMEGHWAADAVEALSRNKFISGYPDGTFQPDRQIIRSEAVTLMNRMLFRGPLNGLDPIFPDMPESHWAFGNVQEATISHESTRASDGSETFVQRIEDDVQ